MQRVRSTDGTMIAVGSSGQGPALVLITGAFTDRSSAKSLAGGLAERYTVYEYDRRGRGDSDKGGAYAIEREIEDLAAVIYSRNSSTDGCSSRARLDGFSALRDTSVMPSLGIDAG